MITSRVGSPDLEIIDRKPRTARYPQRLLFVHGISVGAWIWDENILPYFAEAGFEAYAVSLRGHGASQGHERIATWRLADYTRDVGQAARRIGDPRVLVGIRPVPVCSRTKPKNTPAELCISIRFS
ncbi:alpha/beta hydrolase [Methylobacterium sp. CM6257]